WIADHFDWPWTRKPLSLFLERDSQSNLYGVHSFPDGLCYVQICVMSRKEIVECRGWIEQVHFDPYGSGLFEIEHNERMPCNWSRSNDEAANIDPQHPPARLNIAVFTDDLLTQEAAPKNLHERLQRSGTHRFTVTVVGKMNGRPVRESRHLFIEWRGPG